MTDQERLEKLWEEAAAFFLMTEEGVPELDEETSRPKVQGYVMAREMSTFAMKNDLNEGQLVQPSNIAYWQKQGKITRRVARMFELFIKHKKQQAAEPAT